jgi:hypothetical protein
VQASEPIDLSNAAVWDVIQWPWDPLQLPPLIIRLNRQCKMDVSSNIHNRMWDWLPKQSLLGHPEAGREQAKTVDVVRDIQAGILPL